MPEDPRLVKLELEEVELDDSMLDRLVIGADIRLDMLLDVVPEDIVLETSELDAERIVALELIEGIVPEVELLGFVLLEDDVIISTVLEAEFDEL